MIEATPNGVLLNRLVRTIDTSSGMLQTGDIIGMDVDVTGDFLYFGDRGNLGLFRVGLSDLTESGDRRTKVVGGVKAWGVAYDWVNEYLYWTEDE